MNPRPSSFVPTIETPRLVLRDWRDDDVEPWLRLSADPRVREFFTRAYDRDDALATLTKMRADLQREGYGWWAVDVRNLGFAGVLVLQRVPFDAAFTPAYEIGWRFAAETWGNGYATEGARALLDFAFQELLWPEVVAMTAALNVRSQRVMERLGMVRDPADDFDHPRIEIGHPLRRHVLYRISRPAIPERARRAAG